MLHGELTLDVCSTPQLEGTTKKWGIKCKNVALSTHTLKLLRAPSALGYVKFLGPSFLCYRSPLLSVAVTCIRSTGCAVGRSCWYRRGDGVQSVDYRRQLPRESSPRVAGHHYSRVQCVLGRRLELYLPRWRHRDDDVTVWCCRRSQFHRLSSDNRLCFVF